MNNIKEIKVVGWNKKEPTKDFPISSEFFMDNYDRVEKAIIDEIVKNKYCFGGDTHQYTPYCTPIISYDGQERVEWFGFRSWGHIMADAWNIIEDNKHCYDYMDFYMTCTMPKYLEYKIPHQENNTKKD